MSKEFNDIELALNALTANHKPELSISYMDACGQKLRNNDKNTNDVILFEENSAKEIYKFMRLTIGKNPFVIE